MAKVSNWLHIKIYKVPCKVKVYMNTHGKYICHSLTKKVINKFMIIRYKLQSIYYVYFVENKQRKTYNLI
jgi:hypothetical protein